MDILTIKEIAGTLGGIAEGSKSYNEIALAPGHVEQLSSSLPVAQPIAEFAGIKVVASSIVPDGYGVLKRNGKIVGVIDFVNGTATLTEKQGD
jgi:hypothetical protein